MVSWSIQTSFQPIHCRINETKSKQTVVLQLNITSDVSTFKVLQLINATRMKTRQVKHTFYGPYNVRHNNLLHSNKSVTHALPNHNRFDNMT